VYCKKRTDGQGPILKAWPFRGTCGNVLRRPTKEEKEEKIIELQRSKHGRPRCGSGAGVVPVTRDPVLPAFALAQRRRRVGREGIDFTNLRFGQKVFGQISIRQKVFREIFYPRIMYKFSDKYMHMRTISTQFHPSSFLTTTLYNGWIQSHDP
jgi:hypothetical protein